jgi:hypothetical protein
MNRAERRRQKREAEKKPATYNFTMAQLKAQVEREVAEEWAKKTEELKRETADKTLGMAMILLYTLPMQVLKEYYWKKSYAKRLPGFVNHLLDLYQAWDNGKLDMDQAEAELWRYAGIKLGEGSENFTEDCKVVEVEIPDIGVYEVEIDHTALRGDRYTLIMENLWGEGEALVYGFSEYEIKKKIIAQLDKWRAAADAKETDRDTETD